MIFFMTQGDLFLDYLPVSNQKIKNAQAKERGEPVETPVQIMPAVDSSADLSPEIDPVEEEEIIQANGWNLRYSKIYYVKYKIVNGKWYNLIEDIK